MALSQGKSRRSSKSGLSPGTLLHIGNKRTDRVRIHVFNYDAGRCEERDVSSIEEGISYLETPAVTWINIEGLHDTALVDTLGTAIDLHPLVREDILNTDQRPKVELHEKHLFVVMKMLSVAPGARATTLEQLSCILGPRYVITFQEGPGDAFDSVRTRIRNPNGRHRNQGADYLLYSLIDAVVDAYFLTLESIDDAIEGLEANLIANPRQELLRKIYGLKRDLIRVRKAIWPSREVLSAIERSESDLIRRSTIIYLRDVYDHIVQVIETLESSRDVVSSLLETYLSSVSNRMNEVMKVLTLIATIFIPLTFIAGIYGMNFHHMPELAWGWFYPFGFWGLILLVGGSMAWYFHRRHWF